MSGPEKCEGEDAAASRNSCLEALATFAGPLHNAGHRPAAGIVMGSALSPKGPEFRMPPWPQHGRGVPGGPCPSALAVTSKQHEEKSLDCDCADLRHSAVQGRAARA